MSPYHPPGQVRLALPKGRMFDQVVDLFKGAGVSIQQTERGYRPAISLPNYDAKILNPRNVIGMLNADARDVGFAGADWIAETNSNLPELLNTGLNPVRLVVAAPTEILVDGKLPNRRLVIASEYANLTRRWIDQQGLDAEVLTTYGATEVFPPEDADCIVDNTATGSTLRANGLQIIDTIMQSSTCLYASQRAFADPTVRPRLNDLVMLLESVLKARERVMMDLNVQQEHLAAVVALLPSMHSPTISSLSESGWVAVRAAVPRKNLAELIPRLKAAGACDMVITTAEQLIA
jgi:ATP phosphoribosyltransferase